MENYKNINGLDCVLVTNADGSVWSGLKSAYDEMIAQQEQSTENPTEGDE